jgi:phosphoserine phosphatase
MIDYAVEQGFLLPEIRSRLNETMQRFGLEPRNERHGDDSGTIGKDVFAIRREFQSILQRDDIKMTDKHELTREFYQMCSWFFAGHTRDEMHRFGERVLLETGYGANYFSQSRELINQLSAAGIQTMIISATFQPIVEVAARFFGVPDWAVVGMNLETDKQGKYTTTIKEPVTFREGKVTAANELISRHIERTGVAVYQQTWRPLLAMGDSPAKTDEHLLSMAHVAVAVEPQTPKDADIAKEWFTRGRPGFFLEYESTIGGELANRFSSRRSKQVLPQDSFL